MKNDLKIGFVLMLVLLSAIYSFVIEPKLEDSRKESAVIKIANRLIGNLSLLKVDKVDYYDDSIKLWYFIDKTVESDNLRNDLDSHFLIETCGMLKERGASKDYTIVVVVRSVLERYYSIKKCL